MREIIFRGKRIDNGEWVEGDLITDGKDSPNKDLAFILPDFAKSYDFNECIRVLFESVGQFTGLKDKNGTKIFEGDILTEKWKVIVYWDVLNLQFMIRFLNNPLGNKPRLLSEFIKQRELALNGGESEIKVIGNIHDNPELLKR